VSHFFQILTMTAKGVSLPYTILKMQEVHVLASILEIEAAGKYSRMAPSLMINSHKALYQRSWKSVLGNVGDQPHSDLLCTGLLG
jgi:hypothetical protein